jgi:subtilase family serine protease
MASGVTVAAYSSDGYGISGGTSYATPMVAGGLALILESYPDWNLNTIYNNLRLTATQAAFPNNDYGWGIARFYNMYIHNNSSQQRQNLFVAPNPAINTVVFHFDPPLTSDCTLRIFTVAGDKIATINMTIPFSEEVDRYEWSATYNSSGDKIASGIYITHLQTVSGSNATKFAFVK